MDVIEGGWLTKAGAADFAGRQCSQATLTVGWQFGQVSVTSTTKMTRLLGKMAAQKTGAWQRLVKQAA